MCKILISLISDQTIPNLLLIKELEGCYDQMVFITTTGMEEAGKSSWIEQAAKLPVNSISRIVVEENNWNHIAQKLNDFTWPENAEFIVNQTGGTKVMTLAVFEFFAKGNNKIVYVPIGKNHYEELFPLHDKPQIDIKYLLDLKEYLLAYGIIFEKKNQSLMPFELLKKILKKYRQTGFDINQINKEYEAGWKNYFTGTWFEEYLFYRIKEELGLPDAAIFQDVKLSHFNQISRTGGDNQLDIIFTYNNELYILEAKASIGRGNLNKDLLDQIMYKLSAINKHFGLRSFAHIVTLADTSDRSEEFQLDLHRKMNVLGIKSMTDRNNFLNPAYSLKNIVLKGR